LEFQAGIINLLQKIKKRPSQLSTQINYEYKNPGYFTQPPINISVPPSMMSPATENVKSSQSAQSTTSTTSRDSSDYSITELDFASF